MTLEHAASGRLTEFMETNELNWDAVYAHEAPCIYNYFRFRLGSDSDVEELTARTFERAWPGKTDCVFGCRYAVRAAFLPGRRSPCAGKCGDASLSRHALM